MNLHSENVIERERAAQAYRVFPEGQADFGSDWTDALRSSDPNSGRAWPESMAKMVAPDIWPHKDQALYSALGQIVLRMRDDPDVHYALAVPDTPSWKRQLAKIPEHVCERLSLTRWLVGESKVRPCY